jgi:DnaK suppressor protein
MNKNLLEKIKETLLAEKKMILSKSYDNYDIDHDGDEADEIQARLIYAVDYQISAREITRLAKINSALVRISEGSFGICEECEEKIGEKRLIANPAFTTCISCAENLEIQKTKFRE